MSCNRRLLTFPKAAALGICSLLFCAAVLYLKLIAVHEQDKAAYRELMQESLKLHSKHSLMTEPAKEIRSCVRKDIWTAKNGKESHIRIESQDSDLTLSQKGHSLEAKETFCKMRAAVQKEVGVSPVYQIEAETGFYQFPSDRLAARDVKIFTEDHFYLQADQAEITDPDLPLKLEGNIRLKSLAQQDKETYAAADKASYCPKKRLFILSGSEGKNVLCWQNGSTFSAPELHIQQDEKTIEGIGDVRFSFNMEEKKYFESIFARYL